MTETLLIVYLVVSIALVGIILLQQGKGAEMGASFGAGAANTVFGAAGSGNVLTKTTTILAILFFATALSISYFNSEPAIVSDSILDEQGVQLETTPTPVAIEDELPTPTGGIESEIAPVVEAAEQAADPVAEEATNEAEAAAKAATEKVEEVKESDK